MVITLSTDSNYVKHACCLLRSIAANSPSVKVHCRAVDCSFEELAILKNSHPDLILEDEQMHLSTKRRYFRGGTVLSTDLKKRGPHNAYLLSERQCYVSNTRYRNILYCLQQLKEDFVILLDADAIVRKDISNLTDFLSQYDACCNIGTDERYPNHRCWECSCICVKNTLSSIKFFTTVKTVTEELMFDWDSDQFAIENVYNSNKNAIKLCENLSHVEDLNWREITINNWDTLSYNYSNDTYIWPGSGQAKFTKTYLDEQNKYV